MSLLVLFLILIRVVISDSVGLKTLLQHLKPWPPTTINGDIDFHDRTIIAIPMEEYPGYLRD
jgi:hypothetical protein